MKELYRALLGLAALGLLLTACGGGAGGETPTAAALAEAVLESQGALPELTALSHGEDAFADYLRVYYRIDPALVEDGAVRYPAGVSAAEAAVLLLRDEDAARQARDALRDYIRSRTGDFAGYAPEQAAMAEDGEALVRGRWAALFICPDPERAAEAFRAALNGGAVRSAAGTPATAAVPPETAPPTPTEAPPAESVPARTETPETVSDPYSTGPAYDPEAVVAAHRSGDSAGLSDFNRYILDSAGQVLSEILREDMDDYEKELAVHDWMLDHAEYDPGELVRGPDASPSPDNNNPYGFFFYGKAVCVGYSSTFQLFMDLLDIECITVRGSAYEGGEGNEHAWNMVRLDGDWYCVDVTWDDPVGGGTVSAVLAHRYFNVTGKVLRATDHHWDERAVPEATAAAMAWRG